ncbi:MAG: HAD-IC family P-type ATPase [Methanotrichaceae archaeon]|nr:HAD-IC family P-type ATPase [Methanotrichaceae archaeon]
MKSPSQPHAKSVEGVLQDLDAGPYGLSPAEAASRLERFGPNELPKPHVPGISAIFLYQFKSPLIYILLLAGVISFLLGEWSDGFFIFAVLLVNAAIGTVQEYSAERSAEALRELVTTRARVVRGGEGLELDSREIVPGDVVLLESGDKVPADLRLFSSLGLEADESLLTGESLPVSKDADSISQEGCPLGDRRNMAFAGTLISRGRGQGVVTAAGRSTEIGSLASLLERKEAKPPLIIAMERFTSRVAAAVGAAVVVIIATSLYRGVSLEEVFFQSVALAVSAIPEGLPVALTVALAVGMGRMARRNVIIRRLVAVESLGSCSFIASDKTGTLTMNELTARRIAFPSGETWNVTGEGTLPEGEILDPSGSRGEPEDRLLLRLLQTAVLDNEASLVRAEGGWIHRGDMVDVALLVMAKKASVTREVMLADHPQVDQIPFESERQFSASLNRADDCSQVHVKGAPEKVLSFCTTMATIDGDLPLDSEAVERGARELAQGGYRLLALASGKMAPRQEESFSEEHLKGLAFLGIVGMIDPLRPEACAAVAACREAGIQVAMVTGDHPETSLAIARELMLAQTMDQVVTGPQLCEAETVGPEEIDALSGNARVFARAEPRQKLQIVESLIRQGHVVAVTGDGANDAPALRAAHVGVAMGKEGTDLARESSDLIITDDNFASLVSGVEEGRIVYSNLRKVIFLLISTGAAEIVLFILALAASLPLPLLAVQLLWLNLVTNGIQDVALAFEPAEGDEMRRRPRSPKEGIFNKLMVERIAISALVIGTVAFSLYTAMLHAGRSIDEARNFTMLLMVLFENVQVFNSRSERLSAFSQNPLGNRFLLLGTFGALMVHMIAMYTPGLSGLLGLGPVSPEHWIELIGLALTILLAMEIHKAARRRWPLY